MSGVDGFLIGITIFVSVSFCISETNELEKRIEKLEKALAELDASERGT